MIDWMLISGWLCFAALLLGKWIGGRIVFAAIYDAAIDRRLAWKPGKS